MNDRSSIASVVLAAGLGKRVGGDIPKVLLAWRGRPLIAYVVDALEQAGIGRQILVIGHKGEMVEAAFAGRTVEFVWQYERLGTAHAVLQAEPLLGNHSGPLLVMLGDAPRVTPETIREMTDRHAASGAAATILTAELDDPTGYGRVVADAEGNVERIVEHRDADAEIRAIREINSGMICFDSDGIFDLLRRIGNNNAQGEYYLTDVIGLLREAGKRVMAFRASDPREVLGVNTLDELEALS